MRDSGLYPAQHVVRKCGGIQEVADLLGLHRSVVNRWLLPKSSGGRDGVVPDKHQRALLAQVPELRPEDFFYLPSEAA